MKIINNWPRQKEVLNKLYQEYKRFTPYLLFGLLVGIIYIFSILMSNETHVYHHKKNVNFQGGRIVGSGKAIYQRKEKIISKRFVKVEKTLKLLNNAIDKLNRLALDKSETKSKEKENSKEESSKDLSKIQEKQNQETKVHGEKVEFSQAASDLSVSRVKSNSNYEGIRPTLKTKKRLSYNKKRFQGPSTISFPVQSTKRLKKDGIKLPAGSYLRAKLLTGVEASESQPVPVLLQADYFFVGPNKTKVDLSGCFIIAKSKGNLSIERVEMQASKISCVSKSGRMFERDLNGYVADSLDTSFGIVGKVNSKQSRVAGMGFLSSIVQGVGSAIQQAQTTSQTNSLGGSSSVVTGNQAKHMVAGGVGNAASLVTNWYLKQAQNLLPTINVGSGQDVWIIINDTVDLPAWYFRRAKSKKSNSGSYLYMSRLNE